MRQDHTFVINLDRRPDRWVTVSKHLAEQGIAVTRFPAIDGGWKGCRDSHLAVMEKCKDKDVFMILEDDVLFVQPTGIINIADTQLPEDWDCLYLGASPKEPQERYSENLYRIKNSHVTHAIIWNNRPDGAVDYILRHRAEIEKIDDYFVKEIQPIFNCFLTRPLVCIQTQTQSDTCKRSDVSTIGKNYQKYCK